MVRFRGNRKDKQKMGEGRYQRIQQWRDDHLDAAFTAMVHRSKEMELAVDLSERKLYCPHLGRNMSLQEFQSLMRHDLAEHFEGLPPKDRNAMIKSMWDGFINASVRVHNAGTHPHLTVDMETLHDKPTPDARGQETVLPRHGVLQCNTSEGIPGVFSECNP